MNAAAIAKEVDDTMEAYDLGLITLMQMANKLAYLASKLAQHVRRLH